MDQYVLNTQNWLKSTYTGNALIDNLKTNGMTGQNTIDALIAGLQIELGLANPNGTFGPATTAAVESLGIIKAVNGSDKTTKSSNIVKIIQGACYCKGYDAGRGELTGIHTLTGSGLAIALMKNDMGLTNNNGDVDIHIWKVLLSMKQFKVLIGYGGKEGIQTIQKDLNHNYFDYIGEYVACDGVCQRDTITGIIYAIQKEEGLDANSANGVFGPTTSRLFPTLKSGSSSIFVKILQWSLFINGYEQFETFTTTFESITLNSIKRFEAFMSLPITGIANASLMKYLLLSSGDVNRDVNGCDCATPLTQARINVLKGYGYDYVGRYITHGIINGMDKRLTTTEINLILNNGMHIFPIYQTWANSIDYFNSAQGAEDSSSAIASAKEFGFPRGTVIYFAVDVDIMEGDLYYSVVPYFKAISEKLRSDGNYRAGIYSARNTCTIISNYGYVTYSFVSGMSTGFSGNLGFPMPKNWSFNQIISVNVSDFEIDNDAVSGLDQGVTSVNNADSAIDQANVKFIEQVQSVYNAAYSYKGNVDAANLLTIQVYRYGTYNSKIWTLTAGEMDLSFYEKAKIVMDYKTPLEIYDPLTGYGIGSEHLMAVMNALLYKTAENDVIYDALAGWAGDLVTMAEGVTGNTASERLKSAQSLMGSYDAASTNFSFQDVLADIDAVNIIHNLKKSSTSVIHGVMLNYYYGPDKEYKHRFSQFMINAFNGSFDNLRTAIDVYISDDIIISTIRKMISSANHDQLEAAGEAFIQFIKDRIKI